MTEQALYRKYRPEAWDDVVGQEHIVSVLEAVIEKGTPSHAYLFHGGRGTGKTSLARIFAKSLGVSREDVYEIDAASNRKIEHVRELRETVHTLPFSSPYKVYILDEAHMLTTEAWNALLKTLEEPPSHVIFILATTEFDDVPETIISRCQVFAFRKPTHKILAEVVKKTAKAEGYELPAASADLIALLGDGSFRDTQGILQKVMTASGDKKITDDEVATIVGAPRSALVHEVITGIAKGEAPVALGAIRAAVEAHADMQAFAMLLLRALRAILLIRFGEAKHLKDELSDTDFTFFSQVAKEHMKLNADALKEFLIAGADIRRSPIPELPLELAVIRLCEKK